MKAEVLLTRLYRERMLADGYRPTYQFAIPDDLGIPGDSNGAFFADGVYHLMYLYKNSETDAFHWGHQSSLDLLHWRNHRFCKSSYYFCCWYNQKALHIHKAPYQDIRLY